MSAEKAVSFNKVPLLTSELAAEHRSYWNENNIQEFWSGFSFSKPGQSQDLSYSLAEILAEHMRSLPGYREFILHCHRKDAGKSAAAKFLQITIGALAAIFLGSGNWGPVTREKITGLIPQEQTVTPTSLEQNGW
jgi:hypothetical protein